MKLSKRFLIKKSTNREVYLINGTIYKKAIKPLGFECNKTECEISKVEPLCNSTTKVTDDYSIVSCKYLNYNDRDIDFICYFGLNKRELIQHLEYKYFSDNDRCLYRLNCSKYPCGDIDKSFNIYNVNELVNISLKYNLEPCDLILGCVFVDGKPILMDFGLTEKSYYNNFFRVIAIDESNKACANWIYLKNNHGKYWCSLGKNAVYNIFGLPNDFFYKEYKKRKPTNNIIFYNYKTNKIIDNYESQNSIYRT